MPPRHRVHLVRRRKGVVELSLRSRFDIGGHYMQMLRQEPCVYCGRIPPPRRQHHQSDPHRPSVEHIVPRSKGGICDWRNLAPSCATCNAQRGRGSILLFLAWRAQGANAGPFRNSTRRFLRVPA